MAYSGVIAGWNVAILVDAVPVGKEAGFSIYIAWAKLWGDLVSVSKKLPYGKNKDNYVGESGIMEIERLWDFYGSKNRDKYYNFFSFSTKDIVEKYPFSDALNDVGGAVDSAIAYVVHYVVGFFFNMDKFIGLRRDEVEEVLVDLIGEIVI